MTTAAYVRVSSRAQTHATQRDAIERVARARGDTIHVWYSERFSAKTLDRAVLARLRVDARAGKVAKFYVYRLDRLARSGIRDLLAVVEELRAHGVEVVSVADGFDLTGPAARERLRAEGRAWGRPPRLRAREVEKARQLAAQGLSVRAVAARLNAPRATVHRALSQKVPAGRPPNLAPATVTPGRSQ